jgi:hypothetical protein
VRVAASTLLIRRSFDGCRYQSGGPAYESIRGLVRVFLAAGSIVWALLKEQR